MNCRRIDPEQPLVVFAAIGLCLLGDAALYAVLPTHFEMLDFSGAQLGLILSANRIIRLLSNFWAARLYEKMGPRRPFMLAVISAVIVTFAYGFMQVFWQMLILRLIWGAAYSLLRLKALLIIFNSKNTVGKRGRLSGIYRSMSRAGYFTGMLLGGYLTDLYGLKQAVIILALLNSLALGLIVRPEKKAGSARDKLSFEDNKALKLQKRNFWHPLTNPRMLALLLLGFALHFTTRGLINSSYGLYLSKIFGREAVILGYTLGITTLNGLLLSSQSILELVLSPFLGGISDKYHAKDLLFGGFLLQSALLGTLSLFENRLAAVLVPALIFSNTAFLIILLYVNVGQDDRTAVTYRMADFTTAGDLGAALGSIILILIDTGLNLSFIYLVNAVLLVLAAVFYRYSTKGSAGGSFHQEGDL